MAFIWLKSRKANGEYAGTDAVNPLREWLGTPVREFGYFLLSGNALNNKRRHLQEQGYWKTYTGRVDKV